MPATSVGMKTIFAAVETIINAAITASSTSLGDVIKVHVGGGFPPMAEFPLIAIHADRSRHEHKRATGSTAIDTSFGRQYDWFIAIVTCTGDLETSFNDADDIFEELLDIINLNYDWSDTVDDTNINGDIEYGSPQFGDTSKLTYAILVPLTSNFRWGR